MKFTTRRISKTPAKTKRHKKYLKNIKHWLFLSSLFAVACLVVFGGIYILFSNIGLRGLVFSFGEELEKDDFNRSNFLLLGTGVLGINEGSDLTDTIMVGSFNHNSKKIVLLSIPRDLYVKNDQIGGHRINQVLDVATKKYDALTGLKLLKQEVEKITGLNIHYYAKINFNGFREIIDSLDGVEIDVKEAIYDAQYPKDGTLLYEPFHLPKGRMTLDGKTALKYARSRKTTSDFDRARRQQELLFAIKQKATQKEILTDPTRIKDLYYSVSDNTSTDLSIREIIEIASLGQNITKDSVSSYILNDDPTNCGGFLYPPERKLYGGAAVLLPISNSYNHIHRFVNFILDREGKTETPIQVLNGTKVPGLAADIKMSLQRYCFNVIRFGNAQNQKIATTSIFYKGENPSTGLKQINELIPGQISPEIPEKYNEPQYLSSADIIIELGADYTDRETEDFFSRYIYQPPPKASSTPDSGDTANIPTSPEIEASSPTTPQTES